MLERDVSRRPLAAHIWDKEPLGFYVDPAWCSQRLFAVEKFVGGIWDLWTWTNRIGCPVYRPQGLRHRHCRPRLPGLRDCLDFLQCDRSSSWFDDNVVCNPPYDLLEPFVRRALRFTEPRGKVAMIWLTRRLNAAHWLADTPLARIYLLTPRPSMPPGQVILAGEKPSSGKQDFCWLVFSHKHKGPPTLHWLHRDGGDQ